MGRPLARLASLWAGVAMASFGTGRYQESLAAAERATELARSVADDRATVTADVARLTASMQIGDVKEALTVAQHVIPLAETAGDVEHLTILLNNSGFCTLLAGHPAESLVALQRVTDLAERTGMQRQGAFSQFSLAETRMYLGDWERAGEHLQRSGDLFAAMEPGPRVQWAASYIPPVRAWLDLWSGRWEAVEEPLRRAIDLWEESGDLQGLHSAAWSLGELLVRTGRADEARALLEPVAPQHGNYVLACATTLAWAQLVSGSTEEARATVNGALERMRARNILLFQPDGLRVQGMIAARDAQYAEAAEAFAEAISLARSLPYPYAEARALMEWGKMLLSQGEEDQGREHLDEALSIFQRLGAMKDGAAILQMT